jgi:sec-independent protein translocase protein TatA
MIGGLGMPELIIILVIILIIFGAGKLPEIGAGLGKGIRSFKKSVTDADEIDVTPKREENENINASSKKSSKEKEGKAS